jgi:hypothetical protein
MLPIFQKYMIELACTSEMSVTLPTTTQRNNPRINIKPVKNKWNFKITVEQLIIKNFSLYKIGARIAQLVWQLAMG